MTSSDLREPRKCPLKESPSLEGAFGFEITVQFLSRAESESFIHLLAFAANVLPLRSLEQGKSTT